MLHALRAWWSVGLAVGLLLCALYLIRPTMPPAAGAQNDAFAYLPLSIKEPPPPNQIILQPVVSGINTLSITDIANAGDDRLFVVTREGYIYIVQNGALLPTPFLDIHGRMSVGNWEEGLLSVAFHPHFAQNGYFFVSFTTGAYECYQTPEYDCYFVVERYQVSPNNSNVADPASFVRYFHVGKSDKVHNAGDLNFGPDGYLYIPIGDGGPDPLPPGWPDRQPGDVHNHGQRTDDVLAGILRIDIDQGPGYPPDCTGDVVNPLYTIPYSNPYATVGDAACGEIWATGLRNPWRVSFDRGTGDLYISDVGEWQYEEVNVMKAGAPGGTNFGWHCYEGTSDYSLIWPQVAENCPAQVVYTPPLHTYPTHDPDYSECSITGGYVYRGQALTGLRGYYIFADFCTGKIWRLGPVYARDWSTVLIGDQYTGLTTFGEDVNGELYAARYANGTLYRVVVP